MPMNPRLLRPLASQSLADADAAAYIAAVESADTQALEPAVRNAITAFVIGCKRDGIWSAIKASCILMGARTLSGALTPLVGAAPTNNNFVSGDYDRKTGLAGNNSNKTLNANRNNNADPQNSAHAAVYVSEENSPDINDVYIGSASLDLLLGFTSATTKFARIRDIAGTVSHSSSAPGAFVLNRSGASSTQVKIYGESPSFTQRASSAPASAAITVFAAPVNSRLSPARIAFYSIGESLDVGLYDSRINTLYSQIGAAI